MTLLITTCIASHHNYHINEQHLVRVESFVTFLQLRHLVETKQLL